VVGSWGVATGEAKTGCRGSMVERFEARLNYGDVGKYKMSLTNMERTGPTRERGISP